MPTDEKIARPTPLPEATRWPTCGQSDGRRGRSRQVDKLPSHFFDLEDVDALTRLAAPKVALGRLEGLVVLDEVQRKPELFALLRVLADRKPVKARFLLTGSASPSLVRGVSESLAGRVALVDVAGFISGIRACCIA